MEEDRIAGAPNWVKSEKYDLQAKVDTDHTDQPQEPGIEQYQLMLQRLLAERFKLKLHWETKTLPVYELVVAQDGSKLHESKTDKPSSLSPHAFPGYVEGPARGARSSSVAFGAVIVGASRPHCGG